MELNKIYHSDWMDNKLPDKSVQLIIADPPYFEVKGEFDFIWKSFSDYLIDVEKWAIESKRVLADNGTFFWYGSAKRIAYAQIIFDKHFNLINNLVWDKGSFMGLEESEGLRSFAPCTERILMYSKESEYGVRDILKRKGLSISPFARIINDKMIANNISKRELTLLQLSKNNQTTGWISNKLNGSEIPTREQWKLLSSKLGITDCYDDLLIIRKQEMSKVSETFRPFNNSLKLQEVFNFSNEAVTTGAKYDHETVKPEKLTRALIITCSRPNDLILVPFAGSGTECVMSFKEGRNFIGYETNIKHVSTATKRFNQFKSQTTLQFQ